MLPAILAPHATVVIGMANPCVCRTARTGTAVPDRDRPSVPWVEVRQVVVAAVRPPAPWLPHRFSCHRLQLVWVILDSMRHSRATGLSSGGVKMPALSLSW